MTIQTVLFIPIVYTWWSDHCDQYVSWPIQYTQPPPPTPHHVEDSPTKPIYIRHLQAMIKVNKASTSNDQSKQGQ